MKNKKKTVEINALATGVFKKRKWPWLLVILGALCPLIPLAIYAKQFFIDTCPNCKTFLQHLSPVVSALTVMIAIWAALLLFAILFTVFQKRTLIVTACKILYKKGCKKETRIPFTAIDSIDVRGRNGIIVRVSTEKVKFKRLKNRKEIYDALLVCIQNNAKALAEVEKIAVDSINTEVALSNLAESKIRYFKKLLNNGAITEKQFADYVEKTLETK